MKKIFFLFSFLFLLGMGSLSAQTWSQVGSDIDGAAVGDRAGTSVSLSKSGTRLAIGSPSQGYPVSGHVRVFSEINGSWSQLGGNIVGEAPHDLFGQSVSMSGDGLRLVVGAIWNDGNGSNSGSVRVFKESAGVWSQVGAEINGEGPDDWFGSAVSMSNDGRRFAVSGPNNDGNGVDAGHVRVYKQTGNNWVKVGADIDGAAADNVFGRSVSLNGAGNIVAIGAPRNDDYGTNAGLVRVYIENNGNWIQYGNDIGGEFAEDHSGHSVSLSENGNVVAIGALFNDGNGIDAGHVRVYDLIGGTWVQRGSDIDGAAPDDRFGGYSISLSPDGVHLATGAHHNDVGGTDAGHVRVFSYSASAGEWLQVANDINGEAAFDWFGQSVSLASNNGLRVAAGAQLNDGNGDKSGHARVYDEMPCDADMDGYDNTACGGSDCDDNDASVNPGATEACNGEDDNCDGTVDEGTADADSDGICDGLDNCPTNANASQADADGDGDGDACDTCPNDPANDADGDGICGDVDNCPSTANSGQEDSDCDGVGDACDLCPDGDDRVDNNNDGIPDCSQLLNYALYSSAWYCGTNKINVCHSGVTTCISKNQLSTHYGHGDDIGPCISCPAAPLINPGSTGATADAVSVGMSIFPNPAGNEVTFHLHGFEAEAAGLTLLDYSGKTVWQTTLEEGQHELTLDLSGNGFASGVYFVKVGSASNVLTKRLVVSR